MAESNVIKVIFEAVTSGLDKALDDTGNRFKNLGGVVKGFGMAVGTATLAAGAAAVKLGAEVVQSFGELEQNLGGSEAVFGEYASSIQKTGEEAYKNLGVSQSDYLATANKMGALFQGTGVEQQKSLELTEKAMQRAADMASVMGIDTQMALESVAGAAKGNFTMMDNLGVAMNATNIEAYALAQGLDFTWKTATQAEKAEVAMQMFFENTEQYAGNFARESTQTISGSIGLLQAALGSFTAGLGNANADMASLTGNLVDAFQAVVENIVPVIENILTALPQAMPAVIEGIKTILPMLLEVFKSLFTQVLDMLIAMLPELIPFAVDIIMTLVNAIINNLPMITDAAIQLIVALAQGIGQALPELIPAVFQALAVIRDNIISNLPMIIAVGADIIMGLVKGLINSIPVLLSSILSLCTALFDAIASFFGISSPSTVFMQIGVDLITGLINGLKNMLSSLLSTVASIASSVLNGFKSMASATMQIGKDIVSGIWKGISGAAGWLKSKVSSFCGGIVNNVESFFEIASPSKVFARIGKYLAEGLGQGFVSEMAKVSKEMVKAVPTKFETPKITARGKILPKAEKAEGEEDIQSLMGRIGTDEFGHYDTEEDWRRSQIELAEARGDDKAKKGFMGDLLLMMKEKLATLMGLEPFIKGADERNILETAKNKLLTEIVNLTNDMKDSLSEMIGAFNTPSQFKPLTEYAYATLGNRAFTRVISSPTLNMYLTVKTLDANSADEARNKANTFVNAFAGKDGLVAMGWGDVLRNH